MRWRITMVSLVIIASFGITQAQTYLHGFGTHFTCSGTYYDSGGPVGDYGVFEGSMITFCNPSADSCLRITFNSFVTEADTEVFSIFDGSNFLAPYIGSYSGTNSPGVVTSSGQCLTFLFSSRNDTVFAGWDATIACIPCPVIDTCLTRIGDACNDTTCSSDFYDTGGTTTGYLRNEEMFHTVCPDSAGQCIQVDFSSFLTEFEYDALRIYEGTDTNGRFLGEWSGPFLPDPAFSREGCMTFWWVSDSLVVGPGWEATISCKPCPVYCRPVLTDGCTDSICYGQLFDSGGQSGNYSANEDIIHTICSDLGTCMTAWIPRFQTEPGGDTLYIHDGPDTSAALLGAYSGFAPPLVVQSTTGCLTFRFVSNGTIQFTGWEADLYCTGCPPSQAGCLPFMADGCTDSTCQGNFYDTGGTTFPYVDEQYLTHTICSSDSGMCPDIEFFYFYLDVYDTLWVYEGRDTFGLPMGFYNGRNSPGLISATDSSCITFKFVSGPAWYGPGWVSRIGCHPCGTLLPAEIILEGKNESSYNQLSAFVPKQFLGFSVVLEKGWDGMTFHPIYFSQLTDADFSYKDPTPSPSDAQYYRLKLTGQNGDVHYSNTVSIVVEQNKELLRVFPQPAGPAENIFLAVSLQEELPVEYELFSYDGKMLYKAIPGRIQSGIFNIGNSNLTAGFYFLRVKTGTKVQTLKMVIQGQ